jgi:2-keto-4-pentenoate hydratase/2-oxohepta-3-ene-1,7-dioic acid hydratase in catechol pathway
MKLATFTQGGKTRIGILQGEGLIDVAAVAPDLPREMIALIAAGDGALAKLKAIAAREKATLSLERVRLNAPIARPGKIMAIGLNYADHIAESGAKPPEQQVWFCKQGTSIAGPGDDVFLPAVSSMLDWEAELCFVIGKRAKHVPKERAQEVIFGFMCGNDLSVRDWQMRTPQWMIGKGFDSHAPTGPYLVTADEVGDPHNLGIRCLVNGEVRQSSNTKHLVFNCYDQIAHLSAAMTLEPGDVVFTGTPAGVGAALKPPVWLKAGDAVRVEIDKLGALENRVVAEKRETMIG